MYVYWSQNITTRSESKLSLKVENISFSQYLAGIEFKALRGALVVANSTNNEGLDLKTVVLKMHFSTSTHLVLLNSLGDLEESSTLLRVEIEVEVASIPGIFVGTPRSLSFGLVLACATQRCEMTMIRHFSR